MQAACHSTCRHLTNNVHFWSFLVNGIGLMVSAIPPDLRQCSRSREDSLRSQCEESCSRSQGSAVMVDEDPNTSFLLDVYQLQLVVSYCHGLPVGCVCGGRFSSSHSHKLNMKGYERQDLVKQPAYHDSMDRSNSTEFHWTMRNFHWWALFWYAASIPGQDVCFDSEITLMVDGAWVLPEEYLLPIMPIMANIVQQYQ